MIEILKKINFLVTKGERKRVIVLIFLLFLGMILEVFGLGILIPILSLLLDPENIDNEFGLIFIKNFLPEVSNKIFVLIFLTTILVTYLVKSLFLIYLNHKQNRFLADLTAEISNKLFEKYLRQSYNFHLNKNSSDLIKNIQIETNFLNLYLLYLITICIESGFVLAVLATLIYIEPFGAISIGVFYGFLSVLFLQFTKRKLKEWGETREKLDNSLSKISLEGLGGIKEILILGKSSFFIDQFSKKSFSKARNNSNQATVSQIPRFYLELISVAALVSFIFIQVIQGKDTVNLFTILGVFVAATFRMIPSLNRIIGAFQSIKFYKPSVDIIFNEINNLEYFHYDIDNETKFEFEKDIKIKNLSFNFDGSPNILKEVNLEIKKGQTIGIVGESGSGKSTLIDLIIGLHHPISGEIIIDGVPGRQLGELWRRKIGYVSQTIYLTDSTIKNNIAFGISNDKIDDDRVKDVLNKVKLETFIKSLNKGFNTRVGERGIQISGGQKQRIGIARALYNDPEILILDEATSALDTETEKGIINSISELKGDMTIIMIAHRLTTLSDCDIIYKIQNVNILKSKTIKF